MQHILRTLTLFDVDTTVLTFRCQQHISLHLVWPLMSQAGCCSCGRKGDNVVVIYQRYYWMQVLMAVTPLLVQRPFVKQH